MMMKRIKVCGSWLALALVSTACVDEDLEAEDAASDADDDADVELRNYPCVYTSTPLATNDSESLIGPADEVESTDVANGGCDLHMFRSTANPPSVRARRVEFHAVSDVAFEDTGARLYTKSCAGGLGGTCAVNFAGSSVPLEITGGNCTQLDINTWICTQYEAHGVVDFSANNSFADIRAGMRATDENGDPVPVTITISE